MRKKELNLYKPVKKLDRPYLTPEEINQFKSQFTLFDQQLSIKKIYEAMVTQNLTKSDKLVLPFMAKLKQKQTIGFDEYISEMVKFFDQQNINEVIIDILADSKTEQISKETIKQVLEDSLGRQISLPELKGIMDELKRDDQGLACLKKKTSAGTPVQLPSSTTETPALELT